MTKQVYAMQGTGSAIPNGQGTTADAILIAMLLA
jgi:hypothetical protein